MTGREKAGLSTWQTWQKDFIVKRDMMLAKVDAYISEQNPDAEKADSQAVTEIQSKAASKIASNKSRTSKSSSKKSVSEAEKAKVEAAALEKVELERQLKAEEEIRRKEMQLQAEREEQELQAMQLQLQKQKEEAELDRKENCSY